jgi:hypothetical protein
MRAVAGVVLLLVLAAPAYGQGPGTYLSEPLEWGSSAVWTDANADGLADYCRLISGPRAACTLSTGAGFGATIASGTIDPGYSTVRIWGDIDGDHRADFCRAVGDANAPQLQCSRSTGAGFVTDAPVPRPSGMFPVLLDATADGRADYCRVTGDEQAGTVTCTPFGGAPLTAGPISIGDGSGRAWTDFDGDGRVDFCRTANSTAICTSVLGSTITSPTLDAGQVQGRAWTDVNADGRADYCRRVGDPPNTLMQCTLSSGSGFGPTITSARTEWGQDTGFAWVDFDGDGDRDFCRAVGDSATNSQLFCTLWTGADGFGVTRVSGIVDLGFATNRAWVDHNGDHLADYCRRVGDEGANERIACTISNGSGFGLAPAPPPPPPPAPPAPAPAAPAKPGRITVTLAYFLSRGRFTTLAVKGVPRGSKVVATCSKGCAHKRYTKRNARGTVNLKKLVGGRRMKVGAKIAVTVTHAGRIGAVKTLQIRSGRRNPKLTTRCIPIGAKKARKHC